MNACRHRSRRRLRLRQPCRRSGLVGATIGSNVFARTYDNHRRPSTTSVIVTNAVHAAKSRLYDSENRVSGYALTNAAGRGISVALAYDGSYLTNTVYALPNGARFCVKLQRDPGRRNLVTRRDHAFNVNSIHWYSTDFDLLGRPTNAVDSISIARTYLYNRRGELAAAQIGANSYGYAYDSIGNRQWSSANAVTNAFAANSLNQYTQIDAAQMVYDADGNLTNDGRFSYAYDAENRLVSACPVTPVEGSLAVENHYDHRHRRARKIVRRYDGSGWQPHETHTFVWDDMNFVLERIAFADGTTRTVEYFWGNDLSGTEQGAGGVGGLIAVSIDGSFYIPCYDHNGNIVCYVSETGVIAGQYVYDPYGNVIEHYGTMPNQFNFGFSTKYYDREVDLVGYQYRFLRPSLGRWLNRDPIEEAGGENLYAFCRNSPSRMYDVWGLACRLGTFNVLSLVIDAKPAFNGLSHNPDFIRQGESLLSSLGTLELLSAPASLMTGSALSRLISALDIAAGKMSSPDNNAMEQIRRLFEKLKNGPIEVYGRLEYEMCECKGGKTRMVRQKTPITDKEQVLDPADADAVRGAYNSVLKEMMRQLTEKIKSVRGK